MIFMSGRDKKVQADSSMVKICLYASYLRAHVCSTVL